MKQEPLVSIITVNYNQAAVTADLLRSLSCLSYSNYEMIVVDNGSAEPSAFLQEVFPFITYVASDENKGFAGGNNLGLACAKGEYVFFINNDTEVTPDLLDTLVAYLQRHPGCGMACPKIKFFHQPATIQYAGCTDMHPLTSRTYAIGSLEEDKGQYDQTYETGTPHGASMMVPMKVIKEAGPMCEVFFLYYEELDWSARIKALGYEVHYVGATTIYHKESVSTGRHSPFKTYYIYRNRLLYIRRNYKALNRFVAGSFFLFVSVPVHAVTHLLKGERQHAAAIGKGLLWNLQHPAFENAKAKEAALKPAVAV